MNVKTNYVFRVVVNTLIVISTLLLIIVIGELSLKYQLLRIIGKKQYIDIDNKLGWKLRENYFSDKMLRDAGGKEYYAKVTTTVHGFKLFWKIDEKKRVFIVGDSFTQAQDISNDMTYYGILADKLKDMDFFVCGVGGYGTLQEFMVIDEFFDKIKPQIIVIQLCSNDFINNDYQLELGSYANNNGMMRPYMDLKGDIFYKNPAHILRLPWVNSRLISYLNINLERVLWRIIKKKSVETEIEKKGGEHEGFRHAAAITEKIMHKLKERALGVDIYVFPVDDNQPYYDEFKKIAILEGFQFIDGIPQTIRNYEEKGYITRAADKGHWNEFSHKIAAEIIYEKLINNNQIKYSEKK